jgi:hypothetical protein
MGYLEYGKRCVNRCKKKNGGEGHTGLVIEFDD